MFNSKLSQSRPYCRGDGAPVRTEGNLAAAAVAWSPDAAGLAGGGGAGAQHVRRCEGVYGLDKLPSWAQYDAKVPVIDR